MVGAGNQAPLEPRPENRIALREDAGDHWVVNGQKTWTSDAQWSHWCGALVRTDPGAKQHNGISFLLIDMRQPTVETRPIELIAGASPFCETFFTDTRADKDALLGELNKGWDVGKRLLQHERASQTGASAGAAAEPLQDIAKRYLEVDSHGRLADTDLRRRLTEHLMSAKAHALIIDNNKRSSHRAYKLAINTSLSSQTGTSASRSGSSQDSPYDEIPAAPQPRARVLGETPNAPRNA